MERRDPINWRERLNNIREGEQDLKKKRRELGVKLSNWYDVLYQYLDKIIPEERRYKGIMGSRDDLTVFLSLAHAREFSLLNPQLPDDLKSRIEEDYQSFYLENQKNGDATIEVMFKQGKYTQDKVAHQYKSIKIKMGQLDVSTSFISDRLIPSVNLDGLLNDNNYHVQHIFLENENDQLEQSAAILSLVTFLISKTPSPPFLKDSGVPLGEIGYMKEK